MHRDLKPSNVLLAEDGPRVIDFGISRALESSTVTSAGIVIGSPAFMSPEQAEGRQVGPPSDVFSLGGVLAFAAAGARVACVDLTAPDPVADAIRAADGTALALTADVSREADTRRVADAVLAATVFHFGTVRISEVKQSLRDAGCPVRLGAA